MRSSSSDSVVQQYGGGHDDFDEISNDHLFQVDSTTSATAAAVYASDQFRMFGFKINKCPKTRSHDWTLCPFAHRGEKACRRDPRQHEYEPVACPHFRYSGGECPQGQLCRYAHGIFEYWLHPARYRTRVCNSGRFCTRKVCFFAHTLLELRFGLDPPINLHPIMNRNYMMISDEQKQGGSSSSSSNHDHQVVVAESDDFLASLSGLKVAEADDIDMPWNVIKKIISVQASEHPPTHPSIANY